MNQELINSKEAAKRVGLKLNTFYRYVSSGHIEVAERRGRSVFFSIEEIERYKREGYQKSKPAKNQIVIAQPPVSKVEHNRQRLAEIAKKAKSAIVMNAQNEEVGTLKRRRRR